MGDAYEFDDTGEAESLVRNVQKLRSNLKSKDTVVKCLKLIAHSLEALPQEVSSLSSAKQTLEEVLIDKTVLNSKHKDVKVYAAACMAHMLRIYAPETPYEDRYLELIFELLLWSVQQVADYKSPMFETALTVVQTINQTKSYFLLLDTSREDLILEWVRALLQSINAGSSAMAGPHILELLQGLVGDESTSEAVLEVLLSHLVPPKSMENPHACQVAQAVLRGCEGDIRPQLQKYLTTLILSPISSNSDLHQQCYTLIYQLYQSVPQVLLPVVPHLTSELQSGDGNKRLEAVQLLCKLFSLPGSKLVSEYEDVLEALLSRYQDTKVEVRLTLLESTGALVAGLAAEELQERVLKTAATRLQDFEEKVRTAAVRAVCQTSRRLLVGPAPPAPGSTGGLAANYANQLMLTTPPADLLGQLGSQEDDEVAAVELGVDYTPPEAAAALPLGSGLEAQVRDLAFVQDVLHRVSLRLRDTKASVRKAAANGMMSVFRAVAAAGDAGQLAKVCWLPCRIMLCMKADVELRAHMFEVAMKDGLLGPQVPVKQTAAAWVQLWTTASQLEKDALMLMLNQRTRTQGEALAFVALRRKTSGKDKDDSESTKQRLDTAARRLAQSLPQPEKAMEGLNAVMGVRDNHVFTALQQALAPDIAQQAFAKARSEALARVGSRSLAADFITQLLLWAGSAAWLPAPVLSAVLDLVADDPNDGQGELVTAAFDMLQKLAKNTAVVFSGLLPQLLDLLCSQWSDLQQLGALLLARCCVQQRKLGLPALSASTDTATAKLVKQQILPCLRQLSRGKSSAGATKQQQLQQRKRQRQPNGTSERAVEPSQDDKQTDLEDEAAGMDIDVTPSTTDGVAAPKASKWAVYALATCQDSSSCKKELNQLADELAGSLDASEAKTAGKLQALSAVGRILPEVFGRHVDAVMSFVLDDYLLSYLDASVTKPTGISSPQHSRSPLNKGPGGASLDSQLIGSQAPGAAAVWLKAQAVKVLAAGCVPDSDSHDVPLETMRAVARLAQGLEGFLEPGEDARPEFLADVSAEVAGVFRLAAASALLRLARRHDSRITPSCYCMLALVMQDDLEGVRAAFSAKVFKVVRHFQMRPSTHQLGAKYAAMLPLAAVDPSRPNKDSAARQLREWVHSRRAAVQQQITAAAAAAAGGAARGGGSTLQDLPEMIVSYSLYILAHHPDFPQGEDADEVSCYDPFQYMLQFMLQPLLVASGGTPAGATIPALVKMCRFLKRTADTAEEPCTEQLYVLCDISIATVKSLADQMGLDWAAVSGQYPGSITLPKGLYRPLDKDERGAGDVTYLPPSFIVSFDPEPATALGQPPGQAAGGAGRSRAAGAGRGSKDRTQRRIATAAGGDADEQPSERRRAARGAVGRSKQAGGLKAVKRPHGESDDGWDSDGGGSEEAAPSAQKPAKDQQLTKRQQLLQQQQRQQEHNQAPAQGVQNKENDESEQESGERHAYARQKQKQHQGKQSRQHKQAQEVSGADGGMHRHPNGTAASPQQQQQQQQRRQSAGQAQQRQQQQHRSKLKQQPLTSAFNQAAVQHAVADASSPAPATRKLRAEQLLARKAPPSPPAAAGDDSDGGSSAAGSAGEDAAVDSPAGTAPAPAQNGVAHHRSHHARSSEEDGNLVDGGAAAVPDSKQPRQGTAAARGGAAAGSAGLSKPQAAASKRAKSALKDSPAQEDVSMQDQLSPVAAANRGRSGGRAAGKVSKEAAPAAEGGKAPRAGAKRAAPDRAAAAGSGGGRTTRRRAA